MRLRGPRMFPLSIYLSILSNTLTVHMNHINYYQCCNTNPGKHSLVGGEHSEPGALGPQPEGWFLE